MKVTSPLPQSLPQECIEASRIFKSFIAPSGDGLGKVIPRSVLQQAKGFVIVSSTKGGSVPSARATSGLVIARLLNGTFSAPSAIEIRGLAGQRGSEFMEFLIVLNSASAIRLFMGPSSFALGGNFPLVVGPLERDGEAVRVLAKQQVADMYLYSRTNEPTSGKLIEGSVIVVRQGANTAAYKRDATGKQLLSGEIPPPQWANDLIQTIAQTIEKEMSGTMNKEPTFPPSTTTRSLEVVLPRGHKNTTSLNPGNKQTYTEHAGGLSVSTDDGYTDPHSVRSSNPKDRASSRNKAASRPGGTSQAAYSRNTRSVTGRAAASGNSTSRPKASAAEQSPEVSDSIFSFSFAAGRRSPTPEFEIYIDPAWVKMVARRDFYGDEGELTFYKGDVIYVTRKSNDNWWTGFCYLDDETLGYFPSNYVRLPRPSEL